VYDVTGRRIRVLFASDLLAGFYEVRWDGRDVVGRRVASGVYFARLESSGTTSVRKLVKLN
jgi:hypothetical protein